MLVITRWYLLAFYVIFHVPCRFPPKKKVGSRTSGTVPHRIQKLSFPFAGTTFAQVPGGDGVGQDLQMALQGQLREVARHDVQYLGVHRCWTTVFFVKTEAKKITTPGCFP